MSSLVFLASSFIASDALKQGAFCPLFPRNEQPLILSRALPQRRNKPAFELARETRLFDLLSCSLSSESSRVDALSLFSLLFAELTFAFAILTVRRAGAVMRCVCCGLCCEFVCELEWREECATKSAAKRGGIPKGEREREKDRAEEEKKAAPFSRLPLVLICASTRVCACALALQLTTERMDRVDCMMENATKKSKGRGVTRRGRGRGVEFVKKTGESFSFPLEKISFFPF